VTRARKRGWRALRPDASECLYESGGQYHFMNTAPTFFGEGDVIRIDTETGEYVSRAKGE